MDSSDIKNEITVSFPDSVEDKLLKYAVIVAMHQGKFIFCKHRDRQTLELPGGHREECETIEQAAKRELYEETGATKFTLSPVSIYSVTDNSGKTTYGYLYTAEVMTFENDLHSEIEKIILKPGLPPKNELTYPLIQPWLFDKAVGDKIL